MYMSWADKQIKNGLHRVHVLVFNAIHVHERYVGKTERIP